MAGITVDPSLARGLAKRAYREDLCHYSKQLQVVISKFRPNSRRKGNQYRAWRKAIKEGLSEYIILEQNVGSGKQEAAIFTCWGLTTNGQLAAEIIILKRKDPEPTGIEILRISHHAAQRIFERLNSTEISCLKPELLHCVIVAYELYAKNVDYQLYPNGVEVKTLNGMAVLKRDKEPPWIVVTWIDDKSPREHDGTLTRPLYTIKTESSLES